MICTRNKKKGTYLSGCVPKMQFLGTYYKRHVPKYVVLGTYNK